VAIVIDTPAELRAWSEATRAAGHTIALVPTMGALHAGHLELIEQAGRESDRVVVSIFVNPLQFGDAGDFDGYPRPIDDDVRICNEIGVDAVYVPTAAAMYPEGFRTSVHVGGLSDAMEGAARPGHFDGVATVVAKLFATCRPDRAVFGEKDYQQLAIVRRMADDLDLGVEVIGRPTVRENDGLAMSSRNLRLTDAERTAAVCMPLALAAAATRARSADATVHDVNVAARQVIDAEPLAVLDYVCVFDAATLEPIHELATAHRTAGRVRVAIAAQFGPVRLIDNSDPFAG
jgi:pantoate--beta-alanine ligase